jgi:hypothetical protein
MIVHYLVVADRGLYSVDGKRKSDSLAVAIFVVIITNCCFVYNIILLRYLYLYHRQKFVYETRPTRAEGMISVQNSS